MLWRFYAEEGYPATHQYVSGSPRRRARYVHLYEIAARSPVPAASSPRSAPRGRGTCGRVARPAWNKPSVPLGFFDGKGVLEVLARELGLKRFKVRAAELPCLQPGRSAEVLVGGEVVGWLGEVHPLVLDAFEAEAPVTAFELALAPLMRGAADAKPFTDVPRFPAVELDVALVVAEDVTAERIEQAMRLGRRQAARVGAPVRRLPRARACRRARSPWPSNSRTARPTER